MSLRTQHRQFMTWPRTKNHLEKIMDIGPKLTQLGLFFFDVKSDGQIWSSVDTEEDNEKGETPVLDNIMDAAERVAQQWPHIRVLLTIKNDGVASIFRAIITDNVAQDQFVSNIHEILNRYPWCHGVDIDLERGPNDLKEDIYALYQRLYEELKQRDDHTHVHIDLPPMTGPGVTVGPEKWCEYERLAPLCDTALIMTYGFAWSGSSPGPTSPIPWLKQVLSYAVQAFQKDQILTGAPAFGYRWQIYDYPGNLGNANGWRGVAGGFDSFLRWMLGDLSHTDKYRTGTETQPYIPFASFYEEYDFCHRLLLHVYDYPGAHDVDETSLIRSSYNGQSFLTAYNKKQTTHFDGTVVSQSGTDYDTISGAIGVEKGLGMIYPRRPAPLRDSNGNIIGYEDEGYGRWSFTIATSGSYDVVVRVNYPWWDRQKLGFKLDGQAVTVGEMPQWYPYHRTTHWVKLGRFQLSEGTHTLELFGNASHYNTQFYGFRVCHQFEEKHEAGQSRFTLRPRYLQDVDRQPAWPDADQFRLTLETLRRDPEHLHIWYDDFRDWDQSLPTNVYETVSGAWSVNDIDGSVTKEVTGSGEFRIQYDQFKNVSIQSRMTLNGKGRAGVLFDDIWLCLNADATCLELYQGDQLLETYYPSSPIRVGTSYTLRLRVRHTEVCAFLDSTKILTRALDNVPVGSFGIKSDTEMTTDLIIAADAMWYYPQEAFDVRLPNGQTQTLGRIPRSGVTWDEHWGIFSLEQGEEPDTRQTSEDGLQTTISMDWDYLHSSVFPLSKPGDYEVEITANDVGAWLSTLYLGDADGFSLVVFPDAETVLRISDIAAYEYNILGVGMWTIGQEDERLWTMLVDHTKVT
ncbi:glycosyl hydrolase family 18 protein [Caldalkalibacillus salinus]|uniref:glycosyl hydrolase family 18 protein n=1 Tax=Caldalkalibacillus salinus TaxID=2803787 RepID=UPI001924F084|nr:glycosyl hydrolase family 18 protein [Caldalkalibacillus salinus]